MPDTSSQRAYPSIPLPPCVPPPSPPAPTPVWACGRACGTGRNISHGGLLPWILRPNLQYDGPSRFSPLIPSRCSSLILSHSSSLIPSFSSPPPPPPAAFPRLKFYFTAVTASVTAVPPR
ncbi:hypothetical protein E2C01_027006 [Portunus trituberculatus]|uniref:Uncharacterized protein n=1 Tax=Portunus trituberculatus TaxID=210409 RepID=A0A5B7EKI2_PORTR|nr:hypothetical protein [Portunus trituberculatus]